MKTGAIGTIASTISELLVSAIVLLTSAFFFLAYIPYTNFFLIQAPPYHWLTWYMQHAPVLYCCAVVLIYIGSGDCRRKRWFLGAMVVQVVLGLWLLFGSVTQNAHSDWKSYAWSLALLLPFLGVLIGKVKGILSPNDGEVPSFSYSSILLASGLVAILSAGGLATRTYAEAGQYTIGRNDAELMVWMVAAHLCVALLGLSVLNGLIAAARKFWRPSTATRRLCCLIAGTVVLALALSHYFEGTLTFHGWELYAYAIPFSMALACSVAIMLWPLLDVYERQSSKRRLRAYALVILIDILIAAIALYVPTVIGGADWNNILQYSFNAVLWVLISVSVYLLRPCTKRYTAYAIIAVVLVTGAAYSGLELSSLAWARSLGSTPGEIDAQVRKYSDQNASFGMVYGALHPDSGTRCEGFCRILRQCTNMRDTVAKRDLTLVPELRKSAGPHPNIFIIVIDSMRPDYLGAYNPKVDFTPNIDKFARDSVVMKNAFTSYAGTTLSQASMFAGALLLHSHYPKPFSRQNSLLKLAEADGYKLVVSYDTVLRQLMDPADISVKLDGDKPWNEIELANTFRQLQPMLDAQVRDKRPIFLFTQPINVHQGSSNRLAEMERENWQHRPGFNKVTTYRVHEVDRILGQVFADMRARGIYDDSIIVLTSDHGEGFVDSACQGHNVTICPEVLRVPLIIHLPKSIRSEVVYDDQQVATPSDIVPSLYYMLGHRPIERHEILGRPLFTNTREELESYRRQDLFFASDVRAAYGLLFENGRYMYVTYDSPAESFYYDLSVDPDGRQNIVTPEITQRANKRIIDYLFAIGKFYGYTPTGGRDGL